jgi:endo-1,3(4)-beta-glucanase
MRIASYDQLSVTLKWDQHGGSGSLSSPIVRGSPFITMIYDQMTPVIQTAHALLSVNGNGGSGPFTGTQFSLRMNNGQQWKLFTLNGVSITFYKRSNQLISNDLFTGVIRAAVVSGAGVEEALANASQTYPTGADISYDFQDDLATIQFNWRTAGACSESLLMMALPHHMDSMVLSSQLQATNVTYQTIKGAMTGLRGNTWTLKEQLTSIKWFSPSGIAADKVASVRQALQQEKGRRNPVGDSYTAGKVLASMARLALVADELNDNETAHSIRENLKADLDPWLLGTNWNALKYETAWGGLCSSMGLRDLNADYGQGWYNDHHFHYGYMVYAAAVIGKEDRAWLESRRAAIMDIVRDFANPRSDAHFPMTRNKDWFDGHSWASGLFPFGDSKNQESTSESVNAYYGVYLLGESLGDTQLSNWGRMLLATEIRSVHKYWQIKEDSQIYPAPFKNGKIVGVLWSTKVDYATFFGGNEEYIHCIQMMPFTPITEQLLPASWVQEEYPVLSSVLTRTTDPIGEGWKGFVYMDHAIIDKEAAWTEVQTLRWYDNGNSKTNTLYWVATRPSATQKRISVN